MRDTLPGFCRRGHHEDGVIEAMSEGIDEGLELIEAVGQREPRAQRQTRSVQPGTPARRIPSAKWSRSFCRRNGLLSRSKSMQPLAARSAPPGFAESLATALSAHSWAS